MVEVCKASGIHVSTMCTANIDMAIKALNESGYMTVNGTYKDAMYFKLKEDAGTLVDKMV